MAGNAPFPQPDYFGGKKGRRWQLSKLLAYEAALTGTPEPRIEPAAEIYLTAAQVKERYGGVSDMWLWRRCNNQWQEHATHLPTKRRRHTTRGIVIYR
jgi:hypothetical protein